MPNAQCPIQPRQTLLPRKNRQADPPICPTSTATEQSRREETDILLLGRSRASPLPGFQPPSTPRCSPALNHPPGKP